jgi:hypothetical protein
MYEALHNQAERHSHIINYILEGKIECILTCRMPRRQHHTNAVNNKVHIAYMFEEQRIS